MIKRIGVAVVALAAFVAPGTALAKEVKSVEVCGAGGCKAITDSAALRRFEESGGSADVAANPAAPAPFYRVDVTVDAGDQEISWSMFYVPGARVLRTVSEHGHAQWWRAKPAQRQVLDEFAAGVQPFAAPVITRATVGRKNAANPASYLALYRLRATSFRFPGRPDWVRIRLRSAAPSPWTDGANRLAYSPSTRTLERDGQFLRLPKTVARSVRRAASVRVPAGSSSRTAMFAAAFAVPAGLAGIALLVLLRRKESR